MKAALTLPGNIAELPRLLAFARRFAGRSALPVNEASRLFVIIDELFSNIVRHGYAGANASGKIAIRLSFADDVLRVVLTDDGHPFDPLAAAAPNLDLPAQQRPVGGLGIYFVRKLVDDARYSRRGNRNCLTLIRRVHASAIA